MLLFSVFASAQNQKVRIDSNGQMTLSEVFRQIEQQTNMTVAYNENSIDVTRSVSLDSDADTLHEIMDNALDGTEMTFKIQGMMKLNKLKNQKLSLIQKKMTIIMYQ